MVVLLAGHSAYEMAGHWVWRTGDTKVVKLAYPQVAKMVAQMVYYSVVMLVAEKAVE